MPNVANNYENVRGFLRQVCKASEVRMKREAAKELIAGEWYVVAEYNNKRWMSAGWVRALTEEEEEPETEEYGIGSFVFESVKPFSQKKFENYMNDDFPNNIIRMKGVMWFKELPDEAYIFEQSGQQKLATMSGKWIAASTKKERERFLAECPNQQWNEKYGDRIVKLVVIGKDMDKTKIKKELSDLLAE